MLLKMQPIDLLWHFSESAKKNLLKIGLESAFFANAIILVHTNSAFQKTL